jgi:uncharacterized membrane protein
MSDELEELLRKKDLPKSGLLADLIFLVDWLERREEKIASEIREYFEKKEKDETKKLIQERLLRTLDKLDSLLEVFIKSMSPFQITSQSQKEKPKIEIED